MSAATMTGTGETTGIPPILQPPPITLLLPFLKQLLSASSILIRLGIRFLRVAVYPLRTFWFIIDALLAPFVVSIKMMFDFMLFTPLSVIRAVVVTLYPIYMFCTVACIAGAAVGILGYYISIAILRTVAQSAYFSQPPSPPPVAAPTISQGMLRKRKRKSVRLQ